MLAIVEWNLGAATSVAAPVNVDHYGFLALAASRNPDVQFKTIFTK
jgi:hypothetical protein